MSPTGHLNAEQERYLASLLDKPEDELLYEIARGELLSVTASAGPKPVEPPEELMRRHLTQVPNAPITEYHKWGLEPFLNRAKTYAQQTHVRLYGLLCDSVAQKPNELALDIATGQIKDMVTSVVIILTAQYSVPMSVAIPVAVFLLKHGLLSFCASKPKSTPQGQ